MSFKDWFNDWFTLDLRKVDPWRTLALVFAIFMVALALKSRYMPEIREVQSTTFKRVPEIREVAKVQRVYVPCPEKGIVALDKAAVAKNLDMPWLVATQSLPAGASGAASAEPEEVSVGGPPESCDLPRPPVSGDPADIQVTATAELPETPNGRDVIAVFNSTTGQTDLVQREQPAPWLQFRSDWVAGLRYGVNQDLAQTATAYGSWTFLRLKSLYLSGYTELATDPQRPGEHLGWKGQLDLQYRH